ncbi:MAG: hypothetical protein Q4G70_16335 [Pseudomonadota bacterium]|nr:hypothetical protein [Pseudomonadota bacterium]
MPAQPDLAASTPDPRAAHDALRERCPVAWSESQHWSVLRNWTVGEVGTIAASIGILMHWLATAPDWQRRLREQPGLLPSAIDEVLRIDGPLAANRRITRQAVTLAAGASSPASG